MANNPIKYSDLVVPDDSITQLIAQLRALDETYGEAMKNIREEAAKLQKELRASSGATEEGRKATKAAATDADRLAKAQERLRQAQSENAMELEEVNQAIREAQRLTKLQAKLNNSAEGSYDRLSAQYSLNKIRLNAMAKAEREATEEGRQLEAETKEIYEEMKRLQEATGKHQLNVGNYPDMTAAIGNLGDTLLRVIGLDNEFGRSLLKMGESSATAKNEVYKMDDALSGSAKSAGDFVEEGGEVVETLGEVSAGGAGVSGIFQSIGVGVKALGKTLMGLMANPVFLAISGIAAAGAAFKWWYDYNAGLEDATRLTRQFTGKEGVDLRNFRTEVQAVADTFDKNFREVLVATNAVSKQFGISQDEAMRLVRDGFVAGADANGEYLDTLREYPAYFREAGLSAEDFIAIVSQTATAGLFSDKGIDAIKEANIRLREMTTSTATALDNIGISSTEVQRALADGSKTTFDIMQEVSAKLAEMPESASAVGTAIADIFGGPGEDAGYQYLATLKDINTEMDDVIARTGELGDIQQRQLESKVELQTAVNALFDRTGGVFESLIGNAKIFINKSLAGIVRGVIDVANYFIEWYNSIALLRISFSTLFSVIRSGFRQIGTVFNFVVDIISGLGQSIQGIWKGIIGEGWDTLNDGLVRLRDAIPNLIKGTAENVRDAVVDTINGTQKKLKPIVIPATVEVTDDTPEDDDDKDPKNVPAETDEQYKKRIALIRAREDAEAALETNEWEKKRKATQTRYSREIEDLRQRLRAEKNLTSAERSEISRTITALEQQQAQEMSQLYIDEAAEAIDQQYNLALSEIDLLKETEDEKTRLRLEAEKKRWQQVLALGQFGSEEERKIVENTIKNLEQQIADIVPERDLYDLLGFKLETKQKEAIDTTMSYVKSAMSDYMSVTQAAADKRVQTADSEVEAAQRALEAEIEARNNGYASNVEQAERELALAKKTQRRALEEQRRAQRAQEAINTLQQVSDLITASAKIWAQIGNPFHAIPAIATMWGSFAYSKVKANQLATEQYGEGTVELLQGGSHASGHDIDLGVKADGTRRRAEGGEFFAVINKRSSRKYRNEIPLLINALNDGSFEKYMSAFSQGSVNVNVSGNGADLTGLGKDVRAIRALGERREVSDGRGRIIYYKNVKRRVV